MQASFTDLAMLPCAFRRHLMIAPEMGEGFLVKTAEGRYRAVCLQVFAELPVHSCSGNYGRAADTFACVQQLRKYENESKYRLQRIQNTTPLPVLLSPKSFIDHL